MRDNIQDAVEEEAEINMTPMIDVVFLLIIFFLCIDFKVLEAKLPAYLPKDVGSHSTDVEPQEKLNIGIVCTNWGDEIPRYQLNAAEAKAGRKASFFLKNHHIYWSVGPKRIDKLDELEKELTKIFKDPSKLQYDPKTNTKKPMGVVIEPGQQTTYADVAQTLDAVTAAGFDDISFGGGLGARKSKGD